MNLLFYNLLNVGALRKKEATNSLVAMTGFGKLGLYDESISVLRVQTRGSYLLEHLFLPERPQEAI